MGNLGLAEIVAARIMNISTWPAAVSIVSVPNPSDDTGMLIGSVSGFTQDRFARGT